jgi:glycosyltransferase involved in cell wall biosynthesis
MTAPARPHLRLALVIAEVSGGTAAHVQALAAGSARAGLTVAALGPAATAGLFGASVTFCPVAIASRPRPARDLAVGRRLRRLLAGNRPDVVHAHGVRAGAFAALAVLGWRDRPALVVTVHNAAPQQPVYRLVYGLLERVCARRSDVVLCASADLARRMRRLGAATVEEFDVPAALADPPSAKAVAQAVADIGAGDRPVVLAAGRLAPQKGFDVLVTAAARWRGRDPQPRTVIAGSGPLAARLSDQARKSGADVVLLGERGDVPALLAAADVVVLPSRWEARALIIQEAMQAGRPIVATRSGGTPDLTGPDAAVLVPPDDADALAAAVLAVLGDAARAERLVLAARARAATLPTPEEALAHAIAVYHRVADRTVSLPTSTGNHD